MYYILMRYKMLLLFVIAADLTWDLILDDTTKKTRKTLITYWLRHSVVLSHVLMIKIKYSTKQLSYSIKTSNVYV